jgi:hypothetical protein
MGNENQDTISLLEKCVDVDKRRMRLPEAKGFVESTMVKKWQRYIDEVKKMGRLKTALGWRVYDRMNGRNHVTISSVRGTPRSEISCARGMRR